MDTKVWIPRYAPMELRSSVASSGSRGVSYAREVMVLKAGVGTMQLMSNSWATVTHKSQLRPFAPRTILSSPAPTLFQVPAALQV